MEEMTQKYDSKQLFSAKRRTQNAADTHFTSITGAILELKNGTKHKITNALKTDLTC